MATGKRSGPDDLSHIDHLVANPEEHHVFQALRVLEAHYADSPRLGESRRPREDKLRLGQEAELAFPPTTIASFTPEKDGKPAQLSNRFFGLFGPQGPLPLHLTEYARDRERHKHDASFSRFADMFHHRVASLFYGAWAQSQPTVQFDRPETDRFGDYIGSLIGLGFPSLLAVLLGMSTFRGANSGAYCRS